VRRRELEKGFNGLSGTQGMHPKRCAPSRAFIFSHKQIDVPGRFALTLAGTKAMPAQKILSPTELKSVSTVRH